MSKKKDEWEGVEFADWDGNNFCIATLGFQYRKKYDALWFGGWLIYSQGKWAKKIEKVTVEWKDTSRNYISFSYNNSDTNFIKRGHELAEVLEKYLNK